MRNFTSVRDQWQTLITRRLHRVTLSDRIIILGRLGLYLRSGTPLVTALSLMMNSCSPRIRTSLEDVEALLMEGRVLSQALAVPHGPLLPFETHLIAVGEQSGSVPKCLEQAAELLSRKRMLSRRIKGSLTYPLFIVIASVGIVAFLLLYIFPKILPLFTSLGTSLPQSTRILMGLSDFLGTYGLAVLAFLICTVLVVYLYPLPQRIRMHGEYMMLSLPLLGTLLRSYELTVLCRSAQVLLQSGTTLIPTLTLLESSTQYRTYREALGEIRKRTIGGARFSVELAKFPHLFPSPVTGLIATGEMTGSLPTSLGTVAEVYEAEFDEAAQTLSTLAEPVLMVIVGAAVGGIALSILAPIYQITNSIAVI